MLIKAVECKECKDIVYSRTEDDFRECTCGLIGATGGVKYFKVIAAASAAYEVKKINIKITLDKLYEDWYNMKDDYGLISAENEVKKRAFH